MVLTAGGAADRGPSPGQVSYHGSMDRPLETGVPDTGYVKLSHGYCDVFAVYGAADLPLLIDWLHGPERSNRALVLFDSMPRHDRQFMLRHVESLGLITQRVTAVDRRSFRRQSRSGLTANGVALSAVVSALALPVWASIFLATRLVGRGHRMFLLVGCSALGSGRPEAGPGGRSDGDLGGPDDPDGGDRSPLRGPGGARSMGLELDPPRQTDVVAPAPPPLRIKRWNPN